MLSERLKTAMAAANISQAELARACGVKPPSVHGWLSGKSKFLRGENLLKAAKALSVSQSWLATGRGSMKTKPGEELLPSTAPLLAAGAIEDLIPLASARSRATLTNLQELARRGALRDEHWAMLDELAARFFKDNKGT